MRALTFNVWHGLAGRGTVRFDELEPVGAREARESRQDRAFLAAKFDFVFLQELNPVDARAAHLARLLGYDECHCIDQSGVKVLGWGLPVNLRSGLAILANPALQLRSLGELELSGGAYEFVADSASFQLRERRCALFAEAKLASGGSVLLVNAHLHHGVEPSLEFAETLLRAERGGTISTLERKAIERNMLEADERRARETATLLERIERLARGCDGVLVGCDLNSTIRGSAYRMMREAGFADLYAFDRGVHQDDQMKRLDSAAHATWNSARNLDNRVYSQNFSLSVPDFGREDVQALHKAYDLRPRRIDFLFGRGVFAHTSRGGQSQSGLWADEAIDGRFLSDHFGVWAEFEG